MSRQLVAVGCAFLLLSAPAVAQTDRGKDRLPRLFVPAIAAAAESTVKVMCDGRDSALGTVVSADGLILTKGSELHGAITVSLRDGSVYDARQVGYHRPTDLALLRVEADGLKPVTFADPKAVEVGSWVAAPGLKAEPVAVGVLSAAARKLPNDPNSQEGRIENSNKGYLGIFLADVEDVEGVMVRDIDPKGSAARSKLRPRDIIVELGEKPVANRQTLLELLDGYRPGDTVDLKVRRGDEDVTVKIKLGSRTELDRGDFQNAMGSKLSGRRTGFPAVIQHDSVLDPAQCGGPLVDLDGRVLGINIARAGRVESWALPADVIVPVLRGLKEGKFPVSK
ncbi:MAG: S1C family serine protease [Gemmataceae bacterium]